MILSAASVVVDTRKIQVANVFKRGELAATLRRAEDGSVEFQYFQDYVREKGTPVAFSLPIKAEPLITPGGGVPAFFAGLLPEGYRLTSLRRHLKVSASDELSLLLAVGADTPGDVRVLPDSDKVGDSETLPIPNVRDAAGDYDFSEVRATIDLHSLPGMQDKVSAQMITTPVGDQFADSILKLNPADYPGLVENEFAHLVAARRLGLPVAKAELVRDKHGEPGLLVRRFDRLVADSSGSVERLALEDATQILGLTPAQKYNVAAEQVVDALAGLSTAGPVARRNLFIQFLYSWLTGNGDLHAKNVSLLHDNNRWAVAPMYDLPSTLIYGDDTTALDIDGRRKKLRWRHWENFGRSIGLPERTIMSAAARAGAAAASVDWSSLPFGGSPLNGTLRELGFRRAELPSAG